MNFDIDAQFLKHFCNLKQVFIYVINKCNLRCPQCIYKPDNWFTIGNKEIPYETAVKLLSDFYSLGARKLTLLGGEPTLYGTENEHSHSIGDLVVAAKRRGYEYVRMDTNGTFDPVLLDDERLKMLDEISFSIDGYDAKTNDKIRGVGSFDKTVYNISKAVTLGYKVDITSCVYNAMLKKDSNGEYILERFIYLAENLKINRINFHALIKDGTPIDTWTGDLYVSISRWVNAYTSIMNNILKNKYNISVRIPKTFITKKEFDCNPEYFGFCPAKLGERILVHPNGILRICSGLLCSPYCIADYTDRKILWNNRKTNELIDHKLSMLTPCTNRSKKNYGKYYPLCFSFKPKQDEFVYNSLLKWEKNCRLK